VTGSAGLEFGRSRRCYPAGVAAVTVLLVEDVAELRSVLRQRLQLRGFDVVAEAGDGAAAIVAAARHQPEVVVLDLGLPDLAGHEVLTRLRAVAPAAQVVVYTGSITPDRFPLAVQVEAYVSKDHDVGYVVDLLSRLGHRRYPTAVVDLGPQPADVPAARRFLARHLRRFGCSDLLDDAHVVVTELVTNAFVHAGTRCELRAGLTDHVLRLQVTDYGPGMPDPRAADDRAEHGRGLLLISALCVAWGVEALPGGGKVVWAELPRSGVPADAGRPTDADADARRSAAPSPQ
jgi:CheY-like chemotaxis protein/anti-sigma regulatory factor (Ser/Thr protein kinase)